jgi:hypothetical protein
MEVRVIQEAWSFLVAVVGFVTVFGAWLAIQSLVRSVSGVGASKDTLEHLANGCAGCKNAATCASRKAKEERHELTRIRS